MSAPPGFLRIAVAGAALLPVLALAGCGGSSISTSSGEGPVAGRSGRLSSGAPRAEFPTDTAILRGMTAPGTKLKLGQPAVVRYATNSVRTSLLKVTVDSVDRGRLGDLRSFRLSDSAKGSNVYYVRTTVTNTGLGNLGGQPIALYGKVSKHLEVPSVVLGEPLDQCNYEPLPKPFRYGDKATVCSVLLTPHSSPLTAVQWRVAGHSQPISWSWRH